MNRILVITNGESDLLSILSSRCDVTVITTDSEPFDPHAYDSLCVLLGNECTPSLLSAPLHTRLNEMRSLGKPTFIEFVTSIAEARTRGTLSTERQRMVFYPHGLDCDGLAAGDLLDAHSNECIKYAPRASTASPILTYHEYICAHSRVEMEEEKHGEGVWALWWQDKSTLVSSIRLCNFKRARFSPRAKWYSLISSIVSFLAGERIEPDFGTPVCTYRKINVNSVADTTDTVRRGINWIMDAGILKNGGRGGAHEGYNNRISARTGDQLKNTNIRTDCTCEIGGALLLDSFITGNDASKTAASHLFKFAFDWMQVKDGEHRGMLRWSEAAWETCFQDDAARAIIPLLLCQHFDRDVPYLENIIEALDYMLDTTGEDGIRADCTEIIGFGQDTREKLKKAGSGNPCAHFNSYYHAALLLAYRLCGKKEYLTYAERGLSTLMSHYPNTRRETSETEECCRLVFPLAVLYGVTGKAEHYSWLRRVVDDLGARLHPAGGYAEWDTGYAANCARNHKGECALLANNGDPVADLLYSNNWLPLGFSYAYIVTGEKRFLELWCAHSSFICSAQIYSEDKRLSGAWARCFDMDAREIYGMPHDAGWGPCCIESGWTVGELLIGLQFMHAAIAKAPRGTH